MVWYLPEGYSDKLEAEPTIVFIIYTFQYEAYVGEVVQAIKAINEEKLKKGEKPIRFSRCLIRRKSKGRSYNQEDYERLVQRFFSGVKTKAIILGAKTAAADRDREFYYALQTNNKLILPLYTDPLDTFQGLFGEHEAPIKNSLQGTINDWLNK